MKCPYCEREMAKGYQYDGGKPVQWIPAASKPSALKGSVANGAVPLGDGSVWKGYRAEAFYCAACKMVILPVK